MPALKVDNTRLVTDEEKANAFADHISNAQAKIASNNCNDKTSRIVRQSIQEIEQEQIPADSFQKVTLDEIKIEVRNLKNRKAPGPDNVSNEHIKRLPVEMLMLLMHIFNACLAIGYFPDHWKQAVVNCILKPGKPPSLVESWRLISLISCLGKLFERIVLNRMKITIEDNQIFIPEQYGFVAGKSCTHQLYRTTRFIKQHLNKKRSVGMLCLDLKSAFDVVWHDGIVHKMKTFGFPISMVKLIKSFLTNRQSVVRVGTAKSRSIKMRAGVPQGAVLSPTIFNIFTSDVPKLDGAHLAQFADDQSISVASHKTSAIRRKLQTLSNRLIRYFKRWRITVNGQKSELVLFTKKTAERHRPRRPLRIDGEEVAWKSSLKYLGVILDKRLTYKDHTTFVYQKLNKVIKSMYPLINKRSKLIIKHKLILFKSIYRPTCTYAAPVWLNCAKTHILSLQRMQNRFLKLILGLPTRTATLLVHDLAQVEPLHDYLKKLEAGFVNGCRSNVNHDINQLVE